MSSASLAVMMPVPEPSSRIAKGFWTSPASRSRHGVSSEELGQSFSLRLRFESPQSHHVLMTLNVVDLGQKVDWGGRIRFLVLRILSMRSGYIYAASLQWVYRSASAFRDICHRTTSPNSARDAMLTPNTSESPHSDSEGFIVSK
jgi:hypothetical protein